MNETLTYLDSPRDPEMRYAWSKVIATTGSADGWSYMGSERVGGVWQHSFRNKQRLDDAQDGDQRAAARMRVNASEGWQPANY